MDVPQKISIYLILLDFIALFSSGALSVGATAENDPLSIGYYKAVVKAR
ncbi:hypothetical protein [Acetobacter fabarum]